MELSLLLLSLFAGAQAWPQIPTDNSATEHLASPRSLPVIPEKGFHPIEHIRVGKRDEDVPGFVSVATQEKRKLPVIPEKGFHPIEHIRVGKRDQEKRKLPYIKETGNHPIGEPVVARDIKERGHLALPIVHKKHLPSLKRSAVMTIENRTDLSYYAPLLIGNPAQEVYAQVDTGSFELWVDPDCSTIDIDSEQEFCETVAQFDVKSSKTAKPLTDKGDVKYGKGGAVLNYYTDDIGVNEGVKLKNVQFGVATTSDKQSAGVLGLGKGKRVFAKYNTLLDELHEQGFTKVDAMSIGLGGKDDGGGVIVFGGVDTGKYSGKLAKLPVILPGPDGVTRYWIQMKAITRNGKVIPNSNTPVFLDTGATLSLLPPPLADAIAKDIGAEPREEGGYYAIDCAKASLPGTINFEFEGITIKVTYHEFIRNLEGNCWLGVKASSDFSLLGDTVMRSMYAVIDNDEDMVYLAQYNNCGTDVKTINKSSDIIGFKGTCGEKKDEEKSSSVSASATSTSAASKTTAPPKSVTTVITTSSGTSAVTITSAVKPSGPASGSGSSPSPTPGGNSEVGGTGPSEGTPEGNGDKGNDNKDDKTDDKTDDSTKDGENKEGDNKEEDNKGDNSGEAPKDEPPKGAAGRMTPMGVLASAAVGVAIMAML